MVSVRRRSVFVMGLLHISKPLLRLDAAKCHRRLWFGALVLSSPVRPLFLTKCERNIN